MLTDMYQISMAYSYWLNGKQDDVAVYEMFFRKNPFKGEFTVFAGLEEVLAFVSNFKFTAEHLAYLRSQFLQNYALPADKLDAFLGWLGGLDCSKVKIYAQAEGSLCFPRVPLLTVEGPLALCQMLETPLLCLVNYATLVATNAARFRLAAGPKKILLEFGARRAQGPDGALSASRYSCLGGFDGTSNVLAGHMFGVSISGTMAHAYISSYSPGDQISSTLKSADGSRDCDLLAESLAALPMFGFSVDTIHRGELRAFVCFAISFPHNFLALVDTYDTLASGIPNFLAVASVLCSIGYHPKGIRLDSGDLAYLSRESRRQFRQAAAAVGQPELASCLIVASNDINEQTLLSLNQQQHEIDVFGIGTNLVTCQGQPALGGVYKLVEINGSPRIKLSEEAEKIQIPGKKLAFRLFGAAGTPLIDLMCRANEPLPEAGTQILCKHPFVEGKRCYINPSRIHPLFDLVWDGKLVSPLPSLAVIKERLFSQLASMRTDHLRLLNPTPYKVALSSSLYEYLHTLWMQEAPIRVLS